MYYKKINLETVTRLPQTRKGQVACVERQNETKPDKIYIQMLGSFRMTYQGENIQLGKWLSAKMIHLLLLLISSRGEGVSRTELIRRIYGAEEDDAQASNSLRAMIFRLRRSIQESGLPEGEYISNKGGRYVWTNQPLETELDVELFQSLVKAAFEEVDPVVRVDLLTEACRSYHGDFMPEMVSDLWIGRTNWQYRELYMRSLRELTRQLRNQKRYQELLQDSELVLKRYPSEEWQEIRMECLIALKQYRRAAEYYENLERESRQVCSPILSSKLKEEYRRAKNMMQYGTADMEQIQLDLAPNPEQEGAVLCGYLEFPEIYHCLLRVFHCENIRSQLLLLTLSNADGTPVRSSGGLESARSCLEHAIRSSTHTSDLYTRYGNTQYLVLLTGMEEDGGKSTGRRILDRFEAVGRNPKIMLRYEQREARLEEQAVETGRE